jgi:hypothetical protein
MEVRGLRRDVFRRQCAIGWMLKIRGADFVTSLIVLDSKGIDVTFGIRIG